MAKVPNGVETLPKISSSEMQFYMENGRFEFLSPLLGLMGNVPYDVHLRLIGKRVIDFNLFARCYG